MQTDPNDDYARGFAPFLGVNVYLDSRPLIPRMETEYWVEKAIASIGASGQHPRGRADVDTEISKVRPGLFRVLDLFAGSGCIGLAALKYVPNAHITFADIEPAHFPTIRRSMKENGINLARANFIQTDVWRVWHPPMLDVGHQALGVFDLVLANPPYVSKERGLVSESVLRHEPHEALFADDDGFALIEKTIRGLPEHLAAGGAAWIEHEPFHTARVAEVARVAGLLAVAHRDQYGVERYTSLLKDGMA